MTPTIGWLFDESDQTPEKKTPRRLNDIDVLDTFETEGVKHPEVNVLRGDTLGVRDTNPVKSNVSNDANEDMSCVVRRVCVSGKSELSYDELMTYEPQRLPEPDTEAYGDSHECASQNAEAEYGSGMANVPHWKYLDATAIIGRRSSAPGVREKTVCRRLNSVHHVSSEARTHHIRYRVVWDPGGATLHRILQVE